MTEELARQQAAMCKTRSELQKRFPGAYHYAYRNGMLDEFGYPSRSELLSKRFRRISDEDILAAAAKYEYINDFLTKDPPMYQLCLKRKLRDKCTWLKPADPSYRIRIPEEEVRKEAMKYKTRGEFCRRNKTMYTVARRRKLLDTFEWMSIKEEALERNYSDCIYVYEFPDTRTAYVGRSVEPVNRDWKHRHPGKKSDSLNEYAARNNVPIPPMKILLEGITPFEGKVAESEFMDKYVKDGWTLINRAKGGSLGTLRARTQSKSYCMSIAHLCKSTGELMVKYPAVYQAMAKRKWLPECASFLKMNRIWYNAPAEEVAEEAKKYKTRRQFWKYCHPGAKRALKLGIMDELFPRMRFVRKVNKIAPDGTVLATFDSIAAAARDINVYGSAIEARCKHKPGKQTVRGFRYEYAD